MADDGSFVISFLSQCTQEPWGTHSWHGKCITPQTANAEVVQVAIYKGDVVMSQLTRWRIQRLVRCAILGGLLVAMGFSYTRLGMAQTSKPTSPQTPKPAPQPAQAAEKVFENIQVFQGMPAADLQGAMSFIASSLGVDCDYCHTQDFGKDGQPAKLRAREMIRMVRRINQQDFHGQDAVNCFTCHQGNAIPVSVATALLSRAPRPAAPPSEAGDHAAGLPSVQQVLDKYVEGLGGQAALDQVKTRVIKTARLTGGDPGSFMEVFQKTPGKALFVQPSPDYTLWVGFNGRQGWAQDSDKSYWGLLNTPQLHSILRDAEMYQGSRVRTQYANVTITGREKIDERDTVVLGGTSPEGTREKFYFDAQTGLLLRRYIEEPTIFGWFPLHLDFEDYRDVDGVKMPFVVRMSSAGGAWGTRISYKILEVHQNVPIADEKFDHP